MPKLTDAKLRAAKPEDKPYKLYDENGLFVLVHPNGSKYFRLKYSLGGKEKLLALGVYDDITLATARDLRDQARSKIRAGVDPVFARHEAKRVATLRQANSFEAVAREWHAKARGAWTDRHATLVLNTLEHDVFPEIGHRPITEIDAPELLAALRKVESRDAIDMTHRLRSRCSNVFRYAIATGRATRDPAADVMGALRTRKTTHRAAISRAELPTFLRKLNAYDGRPLTKLGLQLVILTFVRSNELRGACWSEFDIDRAEWRIPAERMKMATEHIVPLSTQALAIVEEIRKHAWSDDLLFPSQWGGGKAMSENTLLYAMYRMGYHGRATVHGFRATASTILNEMGFKPDVIERQLAHQERNKVRKAYNRAEYLDERRTMMQAWADYVDAAGRNVVPIRKKA